MGETKCLQYDPESKQQSLQWKQPTSPWPKKTCISKLQMKTMLITFFYIKSIVCSEFIPQCQSTRLIMWKCWSDYVKLCVEKAWTLAQLLDSPPCQCSNSQGILSSNFWPKNRLLKWNTHRSPLIWLYDLWLFPKIKSALKGWRFQDVEDIQIMWGQHWKVFHNRSSKNVLNSGSIIVVKCIAAQGQYFEGYPSQ
jgi:hypothetical protein